MTTKTLALIILLFWCESAQAVTAVVQWTPNTEGDIAKYRVYRSTSSPCSANSPLLTEVLAPSTSYADVGIPQTMYYCITAVDRADLESVISATVTATYPTITLSGDCEQ